MIIDRNDYKSLIWLYQKNDISSTLKDNTIDIYQVLQNTFKSSIFDMPKCAQILSSPFLSYIYQVLQNTHKSSIFDMPKCVTKHL